MSAFEVSLLTMIRRDYILRMIEEFMRAFARIKSSRQDGRWREAGEMIDEEFNRLVGASVEEVSRFSETELLARLIESETNHAVHEKTLMLTALFKEAGDVAAQEGRKEEAHAYHLKGLHLLLAVLNQVEVFDFPDFVPKVEEFVAAHGDSPLPVRTLAMLMHHHERAGDFGKTEDMLFAMLDAEPDNSGIVDFGFAFYGRLQSHSDATLVGSNLPRSELQAGLDELNRLKARFSSRQS